MTDPTKALEMILAQLDAFEAFDDDGFGGAWCHCDEDFRDLGKQDPHCHVHRHARVFRDELKIVLDTPESFTWAEAADFTEGKGSILEFIKRLESHGPTGGCVCHEAYREIGREDPYCNVHTHTRKFRDMVERAVGGPHCKDCPGPYCPYDGRAYFPDDPDPKWTCSWATTGLWPEREPEPPKEPSPMAKKMRAFIEKEFPGDGEGSDG